MSNGSSCGASWAKYKRNYSNSITGGSSRLKAGWRFNNAPHVVDQATLAKDLVQWLFSSGQQYNFRELPRQ